MKSAIVHDKGLLHRDIKPQNVMKRNSKNEVVLIDFGLARQFIPNVELIRTVMLTPGFAPPEQYKEKSEQQEYTDVYALSATLYFLLTKKVPAPAELRLAAMGIIPFFGEKLVPLNKLVNVSKKVDQAVMQGLELDPRNRPQSVEEWLNIFTVPATIPSPAPPTQIIVPTKYEKLQKLLAAGEWKAADQETARVMLQVAGREKEGWLGRDSIEKFPCEDLRTIDQLWVKYSSGRFGFSVQKNIWLECGGKEDWKTECKLGDRIGWRVEGEWISYDDGTFNIKALPGHLPCVGGVYGYVVWWFWWGGVYLLFSHQEL